MAEASRYRIENDEPIVDVRVPSVERLFDNRDPAPFRDRDLDPSLVEYLIDSGEDLVGSERVRIVFWLEKPCEPGEIEAAFHAHFEDELDRLRRKRRRQLRTGWIALAIAVVSIVGLIALGELVTRVIGGTLGAGLKEGLVISGWVLMWKPVEVLVYESIPWRRQRRVICTLLAAAIEMRTGLAPPLPMRATSKET
jgi:hypothetical protein